MCYKKLAEELERHLVHLFNHEYLFDHPLVFEVLKKLLSTLSSKYHMAILYDICLWMDTSDDRSIVIVASKFAQRVDDTVLATMIDEIKMFTC